MASIPKVFHTLEKTVMTIKDYERYLNDHPYRSSIKTIKCIECGDYIVYCKGESNQPYFKHSPTHEGHGYCSLYQAGVESNSNESQLRKKLFREENISFNFEMKYQNENWESIITIPLLNRNELESNSKSNTKILIEESNNRIEFPIDMNHIKIGELKRITLSKISSSIKIQILSQFSKHDIKYTMDGFIPNLQIYSSLIKQDYTNDNKTANYIENIKILVCKRISGKIYTKKHYLLFSYDSDDSFIPNSLKNDVTIVKLNLKTNKNYYFSVFDVVFNNATYETKKFCSVRGCELVEKVDAVILWPPMNSIGNYKYYKANTSKLYIAFEGATSTLDLYEHKTSEYQYFKVQNINATPFFVMKQNLKKEEKELAKFEYCYNDTVKLDMTASNYYFQKGYFSGKIISRNIILRNKDKLLSIRSILDRTYYRSIDQPKIDLELLKNVIWYSTKYKALNEDAYKYLKDRFKDNSFVVDYLEMCKNLKRIKEAAMNLLMEA